MFYLELELQGLIIMARVFGPRDDNRTYDLD